MGSTIKFGSELDVEGTERFYTLSLSAYMVQKLLEMRQMQLTIPLKVKYNLPLQTIFGFGIGKLDKWHARYRVRKSRGY